MYTEYSSQHRDIAMSAIMLMSCAWIPCRHHPYRQHLTFSSSAPHCNCQHELKSLQRGAKDTQIRSRTAQGWKASSQAPRKKPQKPIFAIPQPCAVFLAPEPLYSAFKKMQTSQMPWLSWDMARLQPASGRNWVESPTGHTRLAREGRPEPFCGPQSLTTKCM